MLRKPSGDKTLTSKCICLQVITVAQLMFFEKKFGFSSLSYKKACHYQIVLIPHEPHRVQQKTIESDSISEASLMDLCSSESCRKK